MYGQFLTLIIALLIFSIQQPGSQTPYPPLEGLLMGVGVFLAYTLICAAAFLRLKRAFASGFPQSLLTARYHRLQNRLTIVALAALTIDVYVLNIKSYLTAVPGFAHTLSVSGLIGLSLYLAHVAVIWWWSHPIYQRIHDSRMGRWAFIKGHLGFNSAVLIPWLMISIVSDLIDQFGTPGFLNSPTGEFLSLAMLFTVFILLAPWLVVRLWGCEPMPESLTRLTLEDFCRSHGFALGDFKLWPLFGGEMLTAGIVGLLPRLRYILITRGLLALLNIEELKAVVAHEMGHVRRLHLLLFLLFFLCYSLLTYAFNDTILLFLLHFDGVLAWATAPDTMHQTLFSLLYSLPVVVLLVVYFRYVFGFFLRNSERQADLYALQLIGHPYTLISSFQKIALYSGQIEDLPSWHHFSIRERIDFLIAVSRAPEKGRRHHQKLYGAALGFLLIVAALAIGSTQLDQAPTVKRWKAEVQAQALALELKSHPKDAQFFAAYGGALFEAGRLEEAESVLKKALTLAPDDATVLNNLAWLYATSPPPFSQPGAALELAQRAVQRSGEPHVLDTLAEAYFAAGQPAQAVEAIDKALAQGPKNPDYYLKQRERFEAALHRR